MVENINWFDIALAILLIASTIFGFLTGFTDKFFSILSWIAAGVLTSHLYPYLKPWVGSFITNELLQALVTAASIFLILLIVFKLGTSRLSKGIQSSPLGGLDRTLGGIFGLISGFLILTLLYVASKAFNVPSSYPTSLNHSKIWGAIEISSGYVAKLIPVQISAASPPPLLSPSQKEELVQKFSRPRLEPHSKGYKDKDRQKLTKLFAQN